MTNKPDIVLVGDGSGTTKDNSCGWACTAFFPDGGTKLFTGGTNTGTNNFAELMPYIQALWYLQQEFPASRNILIVSDSEVTVRCGTGQYSRNQNLALWAAVEHFERSGYRLSWKHIKRKTIPENVFADMVAGDIRKSWPGFTPPQTFQESFVKLTEDC